MGSSSENHNRLNAQNCVQASALAGFKSACITCVATAIPTLVAVRKVPWLKTNLNHTGQALVISGASIAAYFITADKTILEGTRKNADARYDRR